MHNKKVKKTLSKKIQIMKKIVFFALLGLLGLQIQAQTTDSTDCPLITAHPWFVNFETDFDCWHQIPEGGWQNNIMSSDNEHMGITGSTCFSFPSGLGASIQKVLSNCWFESYKIMEKFLINIFFGH